MNGVVVGAEEEGLVTLTLHVASGQADKKAVAGFFQSLALKQEEFKVQERQPDFGSG